MMHIVIITSEYTRRDPIKNRPFVQQQALALSKAHRVTVVAPRLASLSEAKEALCEVSAEETGIVYRPRCWYVRGIWWLFYLLICFWCTRGINWSSVDIVHGHFAIPAGFAAALLGRWYRKPFVLTEHSGPFAKLVQSLPRRLTVRWTVRQARRVVVVSHALQREMERQQISAPFVVIPNIVDPHIFYPLPDCNRSSGPLHLLWVGSFNHYENKGGPVLLEAVSLARKRVVQGLRLTLIGDGVDRPISEAEAQRLGIADVCHYAGAVSHEEVRDWMQRSDLLVLPSLSETFGVVLIEAMACGKPVISTRCGGPEEIVTPEAGILVEPGDPQELADAIVRLAEGYATYDPAQIVAYVRSRFHPERVAQMLGQMYNQVRGMPGTR